MKIADQELNSEMATLDRLLETIIGDFFDPPPDRDTLRHWFDEAKVPRFKSNTKAKRGGGTVYYSVAAVEKFIRSRIISP